MQHLFSSEISQLAYRFRDYIRVKYGQELQLEKDSRGIHVFLAENAAHFAEIMQEKEAFLQQPFAERYEQASWQGGDIGRQENLRGSTVSFGALGLHFAPFSLLIALLCVAVYGLSWLVDPDLIFHWLHYPADRAEALELWRYITPALMHFSLAHLLLNLTWWLYLGDIIEKNRGIVVLLLIFLVSAAGSNFAQSQVSGAGFLGLSGVAYALGGYALIMDRLSKKNPFQLSKGFGIMLLIGIALGFAGPLMNLSIGNSSHISGLMIGIAAAVVDIIWQARKTPA